jgi:hypothetical protein
VRARQLVLEELCAAARHGARGCPGRVANAGATPVGGGEQVERESLYEYGCGGR